MKLDGQRLWTGTAPQIIEAIEQDLIRRPSRQSLRQQRTSPRGTRFQKRWRDGYLSDRRDIVNDDGSEHRQGHDDREGSLFAADEGEACEPCERRPRTAIVASNIRRLCAAARRRSRMPVHARTPSFTALLRLPRRPPCSGTARPDRSHRSRARSHRHPDRSR